MWRIFGHCSPSIARDKEQRKKHHSLCISTLGPDYDFMTRRMRTHMCVLRDIFKPSHIDILPHIRASNQLTAMPSHAKKPYLISPMLGWIYGGQDAFAVTGLRISYKHELSNCILEEGARTEQKAPCSYPRSPTPLHLRLQADIMPTPGERRLLVW